MDSRMAGKELTLFTPDLSAPEKVLKRNRYAVESLKRRKKHGVIWFRSFMDR